MNDASVIERRAASAASGTVETNIKSILLHVQNDGTVEDRLQVGLSLARATAAHLQCIHVTPIEAYVTMETFGIFGMDKAIRKIDAQERQLRSHLETHLATEDVSWDYELVAGYAVPELIRRAALSDLVITGRNSHSALAGRTELAILGDILSGTRTPLLIPATVAGPFDPLGTAIIAWNGSFEAANAVRAGIGLLKLASNVRVIRYTEERETSFPDVRLSEYLSRHGVHVELDVRPVRKDYSDDLIEYASLYDASYILMGGYSHSRSSEFLFGGVTRELLVDCPFPLLMAH